MDKRRLKALERLSCAKSRRTLKNSVHRDQWRMAAIFAFVVLVSSWPEICLCHRQQPQPLQQQVQTPQQAAERSPLSQASYGQAVLADSNGASSLLPGEDLPFANLGQPLYNIKRARKMSAFMPMRGRKDGRDSEPRAWLDASGALEESLASILGQQQQQFQPFREADGPSDLRQVKLASFGAEQWSPRQFANQLAAAHKQRLLADSAAAGSGQFEGNPLPTELMQAKLRRAFHPMRGKKSDAEFSFATQSAGDEFQLQADDVV